MSDLIVFTYPYNYLSGYLSFNELNFNFRALVGNIKRIFIFSFSEAPQLAEITEDNGIRDAWPSENPHEVKEPFLVDSIEVMEQQQSGQRKPSLFFLKQVDISHEILKYEPPSEPPSEPPTEKDLSLVSLDGPVRKADQRKSRGDSFASHARYGFYWQVNYFTFSWLWWICKIVPVSTEDFHFLHSMSGMLRRVVTSY